MKPSFLNLFMKKTHARSRGANHFSQGFLADFGKYGFRLRFLAEIGKQKQQARKALLTGIEQLIDKIGLHTYGAAQTMGMPEVAGAPCS